MNELERCRQEIDAIDREMAALFEKRMAVAARVAAYKQERGLPIYDRAREEAILANRSALMGRAEYRAYYAAFQRDVMRLSREYQAEWMEKRK